MARDSSTSRLLRERLDALLQAMPSAAAGHVGSLHRARVASRRLRAALPVIAASIDTPAVDRAGKHVRRITRALGPVREIDVALQHVEELAPRAELSPRATAALRQMLLTLRQKRRRDMLEAITPATLGKLKRRLDEAARVPAGALDRTSELARIGGQAARRAATLERAIEHAGSLYLPDRLHAVRVAAKKLRYTLEVERELRRSRAVRRIRDLKALQDQLGRLHDLEVLIEHVRIAQTALAPVERETALELDRLIRTLEDECREIHAEYMRVRSSFIDMCTRIREAARSGRPTVAA